MTAPSIQTIPVNFAPEVQPEVVAKVEPLTMTEKEAIERLNLHKTRKTFRQQRYALNQILIQKKINWMPGRVLPRKQFERAMQ